MIYIPQTDDAAGAWLKWFVKYPRLRMTIAMSPRFQRIGKDPTLKAGFAELLKTGRLETALQIPNAPILPLLVDTQAAKGALPPGYTVPTPPYAYPDDVLQVVAQAKAGFYHQWNIAPKGAVLPHGAASPALITHMEHLNLSWIVGALGAPAVDGPYQSGRLMVWDAAASSTSIVGTSVQVWDERHLRAPIPLDAWMQEIEKKGWDCTLPSDPGWVGVPIKSDTPIKRRSWSQPDWSLWIGTPGKNAAWVMLRKTRQALESYKNSGQAALGRLDAAFDEVHSAQSSAYFAAIGNPGVASAAADEREHEFHATLSGVFRLINQPPPEDLFSTRSVAETLLVSSTSVSTEVLADGREHVVIQDAAGDASKADLLSLEVWASSESVQWILTCEPAGSKAFADIYIDLNGQPNAGTGSLLPGRGYVASPRDAWEYALALSGSSATLYQTRGVGTPESSGSFPVVEDGNRWTVTIPHSYVRGSPRRWAYQVIVMLSDPSKSAATPIEDLLDPVDIGQKELLADLTSGKRVDIPFVRVRGK